MLRKGWMVTLSMGVVTFNQLPKSVDEMVRLADSAMYSVKTNGKNGVRYRVYTADDSFSSRSLEFPPLYCPLPEVDFIHIL